MIEPIKLTLAEELIIEKRRKTLALEKDAERRRKEGMKGYRFWCSEGCGFVPETHMCEQWCRLTAIPPEAIKAIKEDET